MTTGVHDHREGPVRSGRGAGPPSRSGSSWWCCRRRRALSAWCAGRRRRTRSWSSTGLFHPGCARCGCRCTGSRRSRRGVRRGRVPGCSAGAVEVVVGFELQGGRCPCGDQWVGVRQGEFGGGGPVELVVGGDGLGVGRAALAADVAGACVGLSLEEGVVGEGGQLVGLCLRSGPGSGDAVESVVGGDVPRESVVWVSRSSWS